MYIQLHYSIMHFDNNNAFNGALGKQTRVSQYQKTFTHSLTPYFCIIQYL